MELKQIMPETRSELRPPYDLGNDPYDSRDNILAGIAYLCELRDRYGSPSVFTANNPGPSRYESISQAAVCQTGREHTSQSLQICLPSNCRRGGRPRDGHQQPRRYPSRDRI